MSLASQTAFVSGSKNATNLHVFTYTRWMKSLDRFFSSKASKKSEKQSAKTSIISFDTTEFLSDKITIYLAFFLKDPIEVVDWGVATGNAHTEGFSNVPSTCQVELAWKLISGNIPDSFGNSHCPYSSVRKIDSFLSYRNKQKESNIIQEKFYQLSYVICKHDFKICYHIRKVGSMLSKEQNKERFLNKKINVVPWKS